MGTLEAAFGAVIQEAREAQLTLLAKKRAVAKLALVFRAVATTLEGLFSDAGVTELPARVRLPRRSRRRWRGVGG